MQELWISNMPAPPLVKVIPPEEPPFAMTWGMTKVSPPSISMPLELFEVVTARVPEMVNPLVTWSVPPARLRDPEEAPKAASALIDKAPESIVIPPVKLFMPLRTRTPAPLLDTVNAPEELPSPIFWEIVNVLPSVTEIPLVEVAVVVVRVEANSKVAVTERVPPSNRRDPLVLPNEESDPMLSVPF